MKNKIFDFEKKAFEKILASNLNNNIITKEMHQILKEQHDMAKIKYRYTGVGFFFDYIIPDISTINRIISTRKILGGVDLHSTYLDDYGVEILLFIANGKISCLEGQGYGVKVSEEFFDDYCLKAQNDGPRLNN